MHGKWSAIWLSWAFLLSASLNGISLLAIQADGDSAKNSPVKKTEFLLSIDGNDPVMERKIDLGEIYCGEKRSVSITMENRLGFPFFASQVSSSCGCISQLPAEWSAPTSDRHSLTFDIELPTKEEKQIRYVTLSDVQASRSIRISVHFQTKCPFTLEGGSLMISDETVRSVEFPLMPIKKCDFRRAKVTCLASEVDQSVIEFKGDGQFTMRFRVSPSKGNRETIQGLFPFEVALEDGSTYSFAVPFQFSHRISLQPQSIFLRSERDSYVGLAMLHGLRVPDRIKEGEMLSGKIIVEGQRKELPIELVTRNGEHPVTVLNFVIAKKDLEHLSGDSLLLRVSLGDWSSSVPLRKP